MEEKLKNDLAGIAYSHPFFSGIVENALNYIKELETEVESQDKTIDKLVEEQEEREKYTHSLVEENESLVRQYEYQGALMVNEYFSKEQVFKHFIPISVIQNKLDYYIGMYEIGKLHEDVASKYQMQAILAFIEDLQEILEKGNK